MRKALFLICLLSNIGWGQQPFVHHFPISEQQGSLSIQAMASDSLGYLYVGTPNGLYRFNGQQFKRMQSGAQNNVTALALIGEEIWVGFDNGALGILNADSVYFPIFRGAHPESAVTDILPGYDSLVWVGTEAGMFRINKREIQTFPNTISLTDNFIYTCRS